MTMFVQMNDDNGMQHLPNALDGAKAVLSSIAWPMMASAVIVLTTLALNLFLAASCSVFDELHQKLRAHLNFLF